MGNVVKHPAHENAEEKLQLLIASKADAIEASEIRRLLVRTVLNGYSTTDHEAVASGLLRAYTAKLAADNGDESVLTVMGEKAMRMFRQNALAGYRLEFPGTSYESARLPDWPECLITWESYPPDLLAELGRLIGYAEAREDKALYRTAHKRTKK